MSSESFFPNDILRRMNRNYGWDCCPSNPSNTLHTETRLPETQCECQASTDLHRQRRGHGQHSADSGAETRYRGASRFSAQASRPKTLR